MLTKISLKREKFVGIDVQNESCMSLARAAKLLPVVRGSRPPHPLTLYRWAAVGLKAKSGKRIFLETDFVGGTRVTSLKALERFFSRKNDRNDPAFALQDRCWLKDMEREAELAVARLRQRGTLD